MTSAFGKTPKLKNCFGKWHTVKAQKIQHQPIGDALRKLYQLINYQVLPSDLFTCFKWPFQGLCDLHLGYQKLEVSRIVLGPVIHHIKHSAGIYPSTTSLRNMATWWFQQILLWFSSRFVGEWSNLTSIFQMGWFNLNHQLDGNLKWCNRFGPGNTSFQGDLVHFMSWS